MVLPQPLLLETAGPPQGWCAAASVEVGVLRGGIWLCRPLGFVQTRLGLDC